MTSTTTTVRTFIPWVEKYRPAEFKDIVLDPINRHFFENILRRQQYFPNLLFYGPPGTGKTTTIISLINKFHAAAGIQSRGLVLHLNASDDRGIDVIRNQINQFVNAKTLFDNGMKFVILDEVDYMTKNAQQALRYLLQDSYEIPVRFCLICNYISKIDYSLKNEFICIRFNQLPATDIHAFIRSISEKENLELNEQTIISIQRRFQSDIRSMINYLQTNQTMTHQDNYIIDDAVLQNILFVAHKQDVEGFKTHLYGLMCAFNSDKKEIVKDFFHYLIRASRGGDGDGAEITHELLDFMETVIHSNTDFDEYLDYVYYGLRRLTRAPART